MALRSYTLPGSATVIGRHGPVACDGLVPGEEILGLHDGSQGWARVGEVRPGAVLAPAVRLLTEGGEVRVGAEKLIGTSQGPRRAGELGEGDALELMEPSDLPQLGPATSSLLALAGTRVAIPADNGCAVEVEPLLRRLLSKAGAETTQCDLGRWRAIRVDRVARVEKWTWADQADLLSALCAWQAAAGLPTELRAACTTGSPIPRELIRALAGARRRFSASWLPAYLPIELRVTPSAGRWRPYLPISRVLRHQAQLTQLLIDDADGWTALVDLALVQADA